MSNQCIVPTQRLLLCLFVLFSFSAVADDQPSLANSPQAMISFVKEAKSYAKAVGKDLALKEFSKKSGRFNRGELYIYAYDFEGNVMAHGGQPELVGSNLLPMKDAKGIEVIRELISKLEQGLGTLQYQWQNPVTNTVMTKLGYAEKVDETYWIGSGVYTNAD